MRRLYSWLTAWTLCPRIFIILCLFATVLSVTLGILAAYKLQSIEPCPMCPTVEAGVYQYI